jgi:hypothetical protein
MEKIAPGPGDMLMKSADANKPSQVVNSIVIFCYFQDFY